MADPIHVYPIHVYPTNDLLAHELEDECACLPETVPVERDDGSFDWMVVHNAWDERD